MEIFILLVILLLCLGFAALKVESPSRKTTAEYESNRREDPIVPRLPPYHINPIAPGYNFTTQRTDVSYRPNYPPRLPEQPLPQRRPSQPFVQRQTRGRESETPAMIQNWKKSIAGLVKLADKNLTTAKRSIEVKDCRGAVQYAITSLENISRALIHCYGGKPDNEQGQEETLRMLISRLDEKKRAEFETTVDDYGQLITRINNYLQNQLNIWREAKQIVDSAKEIQNVFKRMLIDQFTAEIAELMEDMCPKCISGSVSIWGFGPENASFECNDCHFKWSELRS